jgi:hypothetical protein
MLAAANSAISWPIDANAGKTNTLAPACGYSQLMKVAGDRQMACRPASAE